MYCCQLPYKQGLFPLESVRSVHEADQEWLWLPNDTVESHWFRWARLHFSTGNGVATWVLLLSEARTHSHQESYGRPRRKWYLG